MKQILIAPKVIADNGWVFYEKCNCLMVLTQKYRHPEYPAYELHWYIKYGCYSINYYGTTIYSWQKLDTLPEKQKNLMK